MERNICSILGLTLGEGLLKGLRLTTAEKRKSTMSSQLCQKGCILIVCQYVPWLKNVENRPITETVKSEVSLSLISTECMGTGSLGTWQKDDDESDTVREKVKSSTVETKRSVKYIALLSSFLQLWSTEQVWRALYLNFYCVLGLFWWYLKQTQKDLLFMSVFL